MRLASRFTSINVWYFPGLFFNKSSPPEKTKSWPQIWILAGTPQVINMFACDYILHCGDCGMSWFSLRWFFLELWFEILILVFYTCSRPATEWKTTLCLILYDKYWLHHHDGYSLKCLRLNIPPTDSHDPDPAHVALGIVLLCILATRHAWPLASTLNIIMVVHEYVD